MLRIVNLLVFSGIKSDPAGKPSGACFSRASDKERQSRGVGVSFFDVAWEARSGFAPGVMRNAVLATTVQ